MWLGVKKRCVECGSVSVFWIVVDGFDLTARYEHKYKAKCLECGKWVEILYSEVGSKRFREE